MDETKRDRFCRIVEKRMEVLLDDFRKLGKCASKASYDYTEQDVERIISELEHQIAWLRDRFDGKKEFSLEDRR